MRLIRGIMRRAAALRDLWADVVALVALCFIMFGVAILRTLKRLDLFCEYRG